MTRSNIAVAINDAHAGVEAAKRLGTRYAVECGRLLIEAKETVPHGGWDAWLRANTQVSPRTAQLYMRIARHVGGDPAKAQRVADLSLREVAAEVTGSKRAAVARQPLPPEGEAWLAEFHALWDEAKPNPHWKEGFAREIHRRGEISLAVRNRIIKAAWNEVDLTDADREAAAKNLAYLFRTYLPADKLKALVPTFTEFSGQDLAIALGDAIEAREHRKGRSHD